MSLAVAAFVFTFVFAFAAWAQEQTDQSVSAAATATQGETPGQPLVFAEGEQTAQAQADAQPSGPLAGTRVDTISTDQDREVEIITIPRSDCTSEEGASFVLQDEDGTQADFIDNDNVQITEVRDGLKVVSNDAGQDANIAPLKERGGNDPVPALDTGGLVIVTSTDIACEASSSPPDNSPPPDNTPPSDNSSLEPEPQDQDKGPLAGGTAIGKDVLVPGDVIDILPDGTRVVGIDQIVIKTKNCKLTAQGDDLTITMSDRGVPFRIRDGQNADITIRSDGTIVADGRKTLGDDFPEGQRDNPDRLIVPIPVDPENDQFPAGPNDTFPIISSTGIGGEGCHVVDGGDANNTDDTGSIDDGSTNAGKANSPDKVIPDTVSDEPLPDTGGVPLFGLVVSGLFLVSAGTLLLRSTIRRNA
jgi:hypothetical protein